MSWLVARHFAATLAPWLPVDAPGSVSRLWASTAVLFVGTWLLWSVLAWVVHRFIKASPLGGADHLLGAGFGLARGLLVCALVVMLAGWTPLVDMDGWRSSRSVGWLQTQVQTLLPDLPPIWRKRVESMQQP